MIGVLAVGCVTPLGEDPAEVVRRVRAGESALRPQPGLAALPDDRAAVVPGPDLGPWLARKKDLRLLARAARLALPAAGRALYGATCDRETLGLFVAVGREPPDEGDAEPALVAMCQDGRLDRDRLAGAGRALYPPLLPLRTLPNMVLAHVAIQHGIRGENAVYAGGREAGEAILEEALHALREGRVETALVGAAWSEVDLASARDRRRMGLVDPPGEASVFALLGEGGRPLASAPDTRGALGALGPVEPLLGCLPWDLR